MLSALFISGLVSVPDDHQREALLQEALVRGLFADARAGAGDAQREILRLMATRGYPAIPLILDSIAESDTWSAYPLEDLLLDAVHTHRASEALWDAFPETAPEIALRAFERATDTRHQIGTFLSVHGYQTQRVVDELEASCPPIWEDDWGILFLTKDRRPPSKLVVAYVCQGSYGERSGLRRGDEILLDWAGGENWIPAFLHHLQNIDFLRITLVRPTSQGTVTLELERPLPKGRR